MLLSAFDLTGKRALVTGAGRGLGKGIALGLAQAGADVALLDREAPAETAGQLASLGRCAPTLAWDLAGLRASGAAQVVAEAVDALGGLDILVNNAGIIRRAPALEFPEDAWEEVLDINLSATFYLSQAAARHFVAAGQGGKIVLLASMLSFQGGKYVPSYVAAKSAVAGLARALAVEWAPQGIHVNAIAPGYMATDFTRALRDDPERAPAILARIPAGRWGAPEDLQGAVVFLASAASDYIHGAVLPIDGGWLAT